MMIMMMNLIRHFVGLIADMRPYVYLIISSFKLFLYIILEQIDSSRRFYAYAPHWLQKILI